MKVDIEAAGGVIWRRTKQGRMKVLLVHRPKHADWSFPKGKLDPGEDHKTAALREVLEETGLRCLLGPKLTSVHYNVRDGRSKRVKYWTMTHRKGAFVPNREVDKVAWLTPKQARRRLTHDIDRGVLSDALSTVEHESPVKKKPAKKTLTEKKQTAKKQARKKQAAKAAAKKARAKKERAKKARAKKRSRTGGGS